MEFLIERSFLKLVVDSENEFRRSLILRCCISEELRHNLDHARTKCMERSNIFLRKWDHFSRCNVDLQNKTNYCSDQWRVVRKDRNKQITEFCENLIHFSVLRFYNSNEWLPLWRNTFPIRWIAWRLIRLSFDDDDDFRLVREFLTVFLKASSNLRFVQIICPAVTRTLMRVSSSIAG